MSKEATARIKINKLLEDAGWQFFDSKDGRANISLETNVKITQNVLDDFGNNFEKVGNGMIDFLLLDCKGFPLAVLEAKKEEIEPLSAKEQARTYANANNARFVILSNGNLHYLWDIEFGNPQVIKSFPTQEELLNRKAWSPKPEKFVNRAIEKDYVAISQMPNYATSRDYQNLQTRDDFIFDNKLKFLRPYQIEAIISLQNAINDGKDRFLFEMATGTGKTLTAAAIIKFFLKSGLASRVLFLVDRLELEDQAWKDFNAYLKNDFTVYIWKGNKETWNYAQVVISTVQSLYEVYPKFNRSDFDFIISDEAHRSINGVARGIFEYFTGFKLGLTATPKDYLKNTSKYHKNNIIEWERRNLLDTYKTFGCDESEPTFRYSLLDGVKDGFLINPYVIDARTDITTKLLSDEGLVINYDENEEIPDGLFCCVDEKDKDSKKVYRMKNFEKTIFSEETNLTFCKTFMQRAKKDPITGEIGKSIIYCVSQKHAAKITNILNELAMQAYPGKYKSDFAVQITSNVQGSQGFTKDFSNNNLSGKSKFREDAPAYETSKTRVAVTVAMMTTGYDCSDLLNVVLMRPVFSPSDFIQIKGRGTRKNTFKYKDKSNTQELKIEKDKFNLIDYFGNCEYFEEKFLYDEVVNPPSETKALETGGGGGTSGPKIAVLDGKDDIASIKETAVGLDGMRIDRLMYQRFGEKIKIDTKVEELFNSGKFEELEQYIKDNYFDKPSEYFNLEKLQRSIQVNDRYVSFKEILESILLGKKIKAVNELFDSEFGLFALKHNVPAEDFDKVKNFFIAYVNDSEVRDIVDTKKYAEFSACASFSMKDWIDLGKWQTIVVQYIKEYVDLNKFQKK